MLAGCGTDTGQRYEGEEVRELLFVAGHEMALVWEPDTPLDAAPVVVLQGAWEPDQAPPDPDKTDLLTGYGLLQVYVDLPGAPGTTAELDWFGAASRQAVAAALRFAVGEETDQDGNTVFDRRPELRTEALGLVGSSNGGNLAVATLADPELDLPPVAFLAAWETPASAQFVLRETTLSVFQGCTLADGITCELDLSDLADGEPPWLDLNHDGRVGAEEPVYQGLDLGDLGILHSPFLLAALPEASARLSQADSEAWFAWRDASQLADEAVENHPDLAVIVTGSALDHGDTLPGHPQVVGLGSAFLRSGAWVRLLGDKAYTGLIPEIPAGEGLDLADWGPLYPGVPNRPSYLLSHAARELVDRTLTHSWEPDLESALR
jgi:hypothetical protein